MNRLNVAVVFCVALGMAATAAVATLVDLATFRAPAFPDAERLVRIWNSEHGSDERAPLSYRDFMDLGEQAAALDALEGIARARLVWHLPDAPGRRVEGEAVTADYFSLLDVRPFIGRMISAEEHVRGDAVMLLSYDTWGREFGYDEDILGRALRTTYQVNGASAVYTVIGVLGPDFSGTTEDDMPDLEFWVPVQNYLGSAALDDRTLRSVYAIGRLAPGATIAQAQSQADALSEALDGEFAALTDEHEFRVEAFGADWREPFREAGSIFSAAALLLLAVAVINVTLLLLVRTLESRHAFAIRTALGASRTQLAGRVLAETLVLAMIGGAIGVLVAAPLLDVFLDLADVNVPAYLSAGPGGVTLAVSFVILLMAGSLAALIPAWIGATTPAMAALRDGNARMTGSRSGQRWGTALIVVELALTMMLIAGAALLARSYLQLGATDLGFATENRLRVGLFISADDVTDDELPSYYDRLREHVRAQAGVRDVALAWPTVPLVAPVVGRLQHAAFRDAEPSGKRISNFIVHDGFFAALGMPILAGRDFDALEGEREIRSAIISQSLAEAFGGVDHALNQRVLLNEAEYVIVGVAPSAKFSGPLEDSASEHEMYLSLRQLPRRIVSPIVHVDGDPMAFAPALVQSLDRLAPNSAVDWVGAVPQFIRWLYRDSVFRLALIATFGVSALLLALTGLYAVLSQQVVRSRAEIGVRKALGATDGRILRRMIGRGLGLAALGLACGVGGSLAVGRVLGSLLHGVPFYDPLALSVACATLLAAAFLACWLPARRAARVDPMQALRQE